MAEKKIVRNFIVSDNSFEKFGMMVILGTTGGAMEVQMNFFFTFWGLFLLKKKKGIFYTRVKGMPFPGKNMGLIGTWMFKRMLKKFGYEDMYDMLKEGVEDGNIRLIPCSMTMDLLHIKKKHLYDFVEDPVGATTFLEMCEDADSVISL